MTTDFRALVTAQDAARTPEQRAEHARNYAEADLAGSFAELVYNLRDEANLTQSELARRMGTTQSSIARIEAGGNTPTLHLLDKLGRALGVTLTLSVAGYAVTFGSPHATAGDGRRAVEKPAAAAETAQSSRAGKASQAVTAKAAAKTGHRVRSASAKKIRAATEREAVAAGSDPSRTL